MSIWRQNALRADNAVDKWFGEPIELHPWAPGNVSSSGGPDPNRPVVKTDLAGNPLIAIFVMPGASVIGEGGIVYGFGGAARVIENELWISVQESKLGDLAAWQPHDRVYLPERAQWFEVNWPAPSATGRPDIHLTRIQKVDEPT